MKKPKRPEPPQTWWVGLSRDAFQRELARRQKERDAQQTHYSLPSGGKQNRLERRA